MNIGAVISLLGAYLLGSIPTGVWVSKRIFGRDIRDFGDGNTGARNMTHVFGWRAGALVAGVDFLKGVLAILLARQLGLDFGWQVLAGFSAVIGHDFPVFAEYRGGQGMATSLGTMSVLFYRETLIGLFLFGFIYLLIRRFDLSAAVGLGSIAYLLWAGQAPRIYLFYLLAAFLSIPLKKLLDARFRVQQEARVHNRH